jgi:predicted amidophosphoribosyltransferase
MGIQLKESGRFEPEALVPIPLHPKKLRQRGYNQAAVIANGIAKQLNVPVIEQVLIRKNFSSSQTRLGRLARWENSRSTFCIQNAHRLRNKRILLIDDVLTTGATLESCGLLLNDIPGTSISMATVCLSSL